MRPPHWLDGVIGDLRDVDDIALATRRKSQVSPSDSERDRCGLSSGRPCTSKTPNGLASSFEQEIRVAIVEEMKHEH